MTGSRIARFEKTAGLGGVRIFYVTYYANGTAIGQGLARGDELDEWVRDLEAHGWAVEGLAEAGDQP